MAGRVQERAENGTLGQATLEGAAGEPLPEGVGRCRRAGGVQVRDKKLDLLPRY